jgi:hypothetical protein
MQGRKCFVLAIAALSLAACSPRSIMKPDCHSCTVEDQEWNAFAWSDLTGQWRGSVETFHSRKGAEKRERKENRADLRFLTAGAFLEAQKAETCNGLPGNALVLNGVLWTPSSPGREEFDAFVPVEKNKVAYGRLSFERVNGARICSFRRVGPVMGKNRLALPSVSFSEFGGISGRGLASGGTETELSLEFLRFAPSEAKPAGFAKDGRRPASAVEQERPPLMIRVLRISSRAVGERGEWSASEEHLYRLWKAE